MNKKAKRLLKAAAFVLPFILGTISYIQLYDNGLFNAMYSSIRLYLIDFDGDPANVSTIMQIARWTAPLMTATALLAALSGFFKHIGGAWHVLHGDAVALHGDSRYIEILSSALGRRGISGDSTLGRKAAQHIVSFNDESDMLMCIQNGKNTFFGDAKTVYICTDKLVRANYTNKNIILCNLAENCARKYWADYPLSVSSSSHRILLIGSGSFAQELLNQALVQNIFSSHGGIRYDIFGDFGEYRAIHTELGSIAELGRQADGRDSLFFHSESWECSQPLIEQADRIILADDSDMNNIRILNLLTRYCCVRNIHIRASSSYALGELWNTDGCSITVFGTDKELCTPEIIMDDTSLKAAQIIHARYFSQYACNARSVQCDHSGTGCLNCESMLSDWRSLSNFTRYSNVAQADHINVKMAVLLGDKYAADQDAASHALEKLDTMSADERSELERIEHIRWERYHFLNNWSYAPVRNNVRKKHNLLVPFDELPESEQRKDISPWYTAAEIYKNVER